MGLKCLNYKVALYVELLRHKKSHFRVFKPFLKNTLYKEEVNTTARLFLCSISTGLIYPVLPSDPAGVMSLAVHVGGVGSGQVQRVNLSVAKI